MIANEFDINECIDNFTLRTHLQRLPERNCRKIMHVEFSLDKLNFRLLENPVSNSVQ